MRYIYTFLFYLLLPFIFLRLLWRSRNYTDYRRRWNERLGFYSIQLENCVWIHAVSVGETIAALPLIKALQKKYPQLPFVVTTMTPTGAARVKAALGDTVIHLYLPYDLPSAVNRFIHAINPVIAIIMETELWPNLLANCHQSHIPICLMNARLSEKSARSYRYIASLTRSMLQQITVIAAHGQADADRFLVLGAFAKNVVVTGNLKFDLELPNDLLEKSRLLREQLGQDRFIWIAASTHEGEEEIILAAHQQVRAQIPNALLILVPRHPDRFDAVAKLCLQSFSIARRSQQQFIDNQTAVYLGDTMGELMLLYAAADVAFVGGSLIQRGGHNILEPAALSKPIFSGPHTFNFAEITVLFTKEHALVIVNDANQLASELIKLAKDKNACVALGQRANQIMTANRGALKHQLSLIEDILDAR